MSDSLWPHERQHARPPCPSPTPGAYTNSCPLSWWCHPTISSSVSPFSSCPQSFPALGSFPVSQLFASGAQSIGVSASTSILPQKSDSFLKVDHWTEFSSCESSSRDFFEKSCHNWKSISITPDGSQNVLTVCDIFNLLSELNQSLQDWTSTIFKSTDKVTASIVKSELQGVKSGILDTFQTLAEILKKT